MSSPSESPIPFAQTTTESTEPNAPNDTPNSRGSDNIEPVWRDPYAGRFGRFRKYSAPLVLSAATGLEIVGKKTELNALRPSYLINTVSELSGYCARQLGHAIAYLSDIARLLSRLLEALENIIRPIWREISAALGDLWGSVCGLVSNSWSGFFGGLSEGLESAYNYLTSSLISLTYIVFGGILFVLGLEAIGTYYKIRALRPSFYVTGMANGCYHTVQSLYASCLCVSDVIVNFAERLRALIARLMPWLVPLCNRLSRARASLCYSAVSAIEAPIEAVRSVAVNYPRTTVTASILLVVACVAGAFTWWGGANVANVAVANVANVASA